MAEERDAAQPDKVAEDTKGMGSGPFVLVFGHLDVAAPEARRAGDLADGRKRAS